MTRARKDQKYHLVGKVNHQGVPIVGARVKIYDTLELEENQKAFHQTEGSVPIGTISTGKNGEFDLELEPGTYRLEIMPRDNGRLLSKIIPSVELKQNTRCLISLATGKHVTGKLRTQDGNPLSNCHILVRGIEPSAYSTTTTSDDEGCFSLVLPNGRFHFLVLDDSRSALPHPDSKTAPSAQRSNITPSAPFSVRSLANGPQPQTSLWKTSQARNVAMQRKSDSKPRKNSPFIWSQAKTIEIENDCYIEFDTGSMETLSGLVLTGESKALPGARVLLRRSDSQSCSSDFPDIGFETWTISGDDGKFSIQLEPGNYEAKICPPEGDDESSANLFSTREKGIVIEKSPGGKGAHFLSVSLNAGYKLHGRVIHELAPVSNSLVRLEELDSNEDYLARTDSEGKYSLYLPAGKYLMSAMAPPPTKPAAEGTSQGRNLAPWSKSINITDETRVDVKFQEGYEVSGSLTDESDKPIVGIDINFFAESAHEQSNGDLSESARPVARAVSDSQGFYSVMLAAGKYLSRVESDKASTREIEVPRSQVRHDLIWKEHYNIAFEVLTDSGEPVPNCKIEVSEYASTNNSTALDSEPALLGRQPRSQEDGKCMIVLPRGLYCVAIVPPADGSFESRQIRQLSVAGDLTRKITLARKEETSLS